MLKQPPLGALAECSPEEFYILGYRHRVDRLKHNTHTSKREIIAFHRCRSDIPSTLCGFCFTSFLGDALSNNFVATKGGV